MKWVHSVCELTSVSVCAEGRLLRVTWWGGCLPMQGDPEGVPGVGVSLIVARRGTLGGEETILGQSPGLLKAPPHTPAEP